MDMRQFKTQRADLSQPMANSNSALTLTPAPSPLARETIAKHADNCDPCFRPGSIIVHYRNDYAAFLPIDTLPKEHYDTCWTAQHLSWTSFIEQTQAQLNINVGDKELMADVGLSKLMAIQIGKHWRLALQMCHDQGRSQCVFYLLDENVVAEPPTEELANEQALRRGRAGTLAAAVGLVGVVAAGAAAVQIGLFDPVHYF
ncbi:hypothetical protein N0V94_004878 [Neodidymelliopsis sp. IMI 364377]|nr:hypothetical protein N0V94_004878 [Neodidymelliopsis sp. IMI 364377]